MTARFFIAMIASVGFLLLQPVDVLAQSADALKLELRWSAATDVPVGYRGRILPSPGSAVTITAQNAPRGVRYLWDLNDIRYANDSGDNRSSFTFTVPPTAGTLTVRLTVRNAVQTLGSTEATIPVTPIVTLLRADRANRSTLLQPNTTLTLNASSARFSLLSFFLPRPWLNAYRIQWDIGGQQTSEPLTRIPILDFAITNRDENGRIVPLTATVLNPQESAVLRIPVSLHIQEAESPPTL